MPETTPHPPTPEEYLRMVKAKVNEDDSDANRLSLQLHCPPEAIPIYLKQLLREVIRREINTWSRLDPEGAAQVLQGTDAFVDEYLDDILSQ